jgi:hypothetical protein
VLESTVEFVVSQTSENPGWIFKFVPVLVKRSQVGHGEALPAR